MTVTFTLVWYGTPPTEVVTPTATEVTTETPTATATETFPPATEAPTVTPTPTPAPGRTPTQPGPRCDLLAVSIIPDSPFRGGTVRVSLANDAPNPCSSPMGSYPRYPHGATLTLSAVPNTARGFFFDFWNTTDIKISDRSQTELTFTLKYDTFIGARFARCYTLRLLNDSLNRGVAAIAPLADRTRYCNNGAGYKEGTLVQFNAAPKPEYVLAEWTDETGRGIGYTNPFSLTVKSSPPASVEQTLTVIPTFVKRASVPMNVYIVAYTRAPVADPVGRTRKLFQEVMQALTLGTAYHHYRNADSDPYLGWRAIPVRGVPGEIVHVLHKTIPSYCLNDAFGPLCRDPEGNSKTEADYAQIFEQIKTELKDDVCKMIEEGKIQEVWIWTSGASSGVGHQPEHVALGPNYSVPAGDMGATKIPNCGKQYAVMGFNYTDPLANAMESYGHRLEYAFDKLFPCEFDVPVKTNDGKKDYWPGGATAGPAVNRCSSDRGYTVRAPTQTDTAQCGWAHYPPNVTFDDESSKTVIKKLEWQGYNKPGLKFMTGCADWNPDPNVSQTTTPVITCQDARAWRCQSSLDGLDENKTNFHIWWMQNLPGPGNSIYRCDGKTKTGNWWDYLRGDAKNPQEARDRALWCNPNPVTNGSLSGQVLAGPLAGATVTLYTLEPGGVLAPVTLTEQILTGADGAYTIPALPSELDGHTLVIRAEGGAFLDEATGQVVSFEDHSLYSVVPAVDLNRPLGGIVTPFTDLVFRLTQHALSADPSRSPDAEAYFYNFWIAMIFDLGKIERSPIDLTLIPPANLYDGQPHAFDSASTTYALALAGLSQQAADAGLSPAEWIAQLSADAADGRLDAAALVSAQSLQAAQAEFLRGPHNPLGLPDDAPDTLEAATSTSPNNENLRYFLTSNTDEDWFRFHVEEMGQIEILLTSLPANYDLSVYNAAGQLLASSTQDDKAAETVLLKNVFSSDYYVRITGVGGVWDADNPYQLRFNVAGTGGSK